MGLLSSNLACDTEYSDKLSFGEVEFSSDTPVIKEKYFDYGMTASF
jgi:hypothetical protein